MTDIIHNMFEKAEWDALLAIMNNLNTIINSKIRDKCNKIVWHVGKLDPACICRLLVL